MKNNPSRQGRQKYTPALFSNPNLQVIFTITLVSILSVSSIAPVLGAIVEAFSISEVHAGLVMTAFTLPGIFLVPVHGMLADRLGRKKVLVPALCLYAAAGTACFFAKDFNTLLALRFVQGIGNAALAVLNLTLIGDLFEPRQRAGALGLNEMNLSIGTALFPLAGGGLGLLGWNYPFLLPLLAIPVAMLVLLRLKNPEPLLHESWPAYFANARKILANPKALLYLTVMMLMFLLVYAVCLTLFPLFLKQRYGASPLTVGCFLAVMSAGTAFAASQLRTLHTWIGPKRLLKTGFVIYALAGSLTFWQPALPWLVLPALALGLANGMNIPTLHTILVEIAPAPYRAAFMSVSGVAFHTGQALGPFLMGWILFLAPLPAGFAASAFGAGVVLLMLSVRVKHRQS